LFAAVNGNTINIFSTYTCENIGNLRGHNGKVRSMAWSADDSKMVSCGVDGAVYEWSMKDFKRAGEHVLKECNYSAVTCTPDGKNMFAVGSDKKIKEIMDSNVIKDAESDCLLTCIVLSSSGRMLFAGTESGAIRSYKYPLTGEFQEYATPPFFQRIFVTFEQVPVLQPPRFPHLRVNRRNPVVLLR
jgi:WD40 repeat protein